MQLGAHVDITHLVHNYTNAKSLYKFLSSDSASPRLEAMPSSGREAKSQDLHGICFNDVCLGLNEEDLDQLAISRLQDARHSDNQARMDIKAAAKGRETHGMSLREFNSGTSSTHPSLRLSSCFYPKVLNPNARFSFVLKFVTQYILVRPFPSLRILFASGSMKPEEVVQSPLLSLINGSTRVCESLCSAFEGGRKVTAKVQWGSKGVQPLGIYWIHCTPLLSQKDNVAVWVIIFVDSEKSSRDQIQPSETAGGIVLDGKSTHNAAVTPWEANEGLHALKESVTLPTRNAVSTSSRSEASQARLQKSLQSDRGGSSVVSTNSSNEASDSAGSSGRRVTHMRETPSRRNDDRNLPEPGSSAIVDQMRPQLRSFSPPSTSDKRPPIKFPGNSDGKSETSQEPPRKTYKSLSPYGVLFSD